MNKRIEKWGIVCKDPHIAPELRKQYLTGEIYNHPNHKDGKPITTSRIVGQRNGLVVTRSGTEYELGEVAEEYEKLYPLARERFFKTLPEV